MGDRRVSVPFPFLRAKYVVAAFALLYHIHLKISERGLGGALNPDRDDIDVCTRITLLLLGVTSLPLLASLGGTLLLLGGTHYCQIFGVEDSLLEEVVAIGVRFLTHLHGGALVGGSDPTLRVESPLEHLIRHPIT